MKSKKSKEIFEHNIFWHNCDSIELYVKIDKVIDKNTDYHQNEQVQVKNNGYGLHNSTIELILKHS